MIVEVRCPDGLGTPEWLILELQGKLLPASCLGDAPLDGHLLGRLDPSPSGDPNRVLLNVGTYRVSGSLCVLKKPLLVLHRELATTARDLSDVDMLSADDAEADAASAAASAAAAYIVRAVVRRKILCDERPQPVVGSAAI